MLFIKLDIEEIVKTKFKPGCPLAMYESVESGISPLMVIPRTIQATKEDICLEEAAAKFQGIRSQYEALKMKKSDPRRPQRNWYELKEMLTVFAELLWVFFGYLCF